MTSANQPSPVTFGHDTLDRETAFVWPPKQFIEAPIELDAPTLDLDPIRPPRSGVFGTIERDFLGVRSLSFARWAAASGWMPESSTRSCWRCAGSVGPHEVDGDGCANCRTKKLAWSRAIRLGRFESGLRSGVLELKFGRWRRSGREIGQVIGERIRFELESLDIDPQEAAIVPVPAPWRRRVARGVDHTLVLSFGASKACGVPIVRGMTRKHSQPQVGLSATARAANVRGVFQMKPAETGPLASKRVVILLDDVRTTGATMTSACRAVRKAIGKSPEIWCCVAAVAADRRGSGALEGPEGQEHHKFNKSFGVVV